MKILFFEAKWWIIVERGCEYFKMKGVVLGRRGLGLEAGTRLGTTRLLTPPDSFPAPSTPHNTPMTPSYLGGRRIPMCFARNP